VEASSERTALIVGAGIGGLAAGMALQRAGWSVRVFERAAHSRELGFALLLAPNAIASPQRLGIADAAVNGGWTVESGAIYGTHGRVSRRFDLTRIRHLLAHSLTMHETMRRRVGLTVPRRRECGGVAAAAAGVF
jgi:2-polyprenyl-6-methoxyphenol hydroxylase-like FAD-dependent oxidoreductase